jgi:hypothetical protein
MFKNFFNSSIAAEYGTLLGIDKKNQYRELKIATKFLLSAIIKVPVISLIAGLNTLILK